MSEILKIAITKFDPNPYQPKTRVDIKPDVEFSFVHMVCLFVRVSLVESERVSAQYGAVLADRPSRAARVL